MKRGLISQMKNNAIDNIWLIVGLTVASLAIWFFGSSLFTILRYRFLPLGFDAENVFVFDIERIYNESPEFIGTGEDFEVIYSEDLKSLIRRLRESPNVEAAAFSRNGGLPYADGFDSKKLFLPKGNDTLVYFGHEREMSPEMVKVLRLQSRTGKDADYLQKKLEQGDMLVSNVYVYPDWTEGTAYAKDINGQYPLRMSFNEDMDEVFVKTHIADEIEIIRMNGYDYPPGGTIIVPIDEKAVLPWVYNVVVRVKPGCAGKFYDEFMATREMRQQRNVSLYNMQALSDRGRDIERSADLDVRLYSVFIVFMLIIIFLGLLGTFWFRIQQRVGEIAIRRVCGASRFDIFRRLLGESMVLLFCASGLTAIIGWVTIHKLDFNDKFTTGELIWLEVATMALVAIGIVLSILGPAWMAMRINPAEAVKDE
ncbi:MAG: hypothetical protein K2J63_08355 [Muribaculaceae bacterium]|nr:hypothetical protein [Muribaculaceae bacterium]